MRLKLQNKFNEIESLGVFRRPEDIAVTIEYLNLSFLVKKQNGGHCQETAFSNIGRYSKSQPSLVPDVDSTIRIITSWKYIIVSDLSNAFYQIPLAKSCMLYCGVVTSFQGITVYVRWVCQAQKQLLRSLYGIFMATYCRNVLSLELLMIFIVVEIHWKSIRTTGGQFCKPCHSVTCGKRIPLLDARTFFAMRNALHSEFV